MINESKPVAWIDDSGHPKHRLYWQSATEQRLYGPLRPLYTHPPDHREAMRQALDALEAPRDALWNKTTTAAINALRAALGEAKS
jgi:hypothetical protein